MKNTVRSAGIIILLWGGLIVLGALLNMSDDARRGQHPVFSRLLTGWFFDHALLIVLTCGFHELFRRRPALAASRRMFLLMWTSLVVFFLPAQVMFQRATRLWLDGQPVFADGFWLPHPRPTPCMSFSSFHG